MPATLISLHPLDDPNNPPNEAEQRVCDLLMALGDGFVIRWGFYYSNETGSEQGEGDFLVQGPDGNVLHIEVKSGPVKFNHKTHRFLTADGEDPLRQRERVWSHVVRTLKTQGLEMGLREPFVKRMLGLPDVTISPDETTYETMPREGILDYEDLSAINARWKGLFRRVESDADQLRTVFLAVYGAGLKPGTTRHLLDFMDRMIERQTSASYPVLNALQENRQFLFQGGPGTGKTWLAIEQAKRWVGEGRRVLFLTYNLKLADLIGHLAMKLPAPGMIVFSYEGLAEWIYGQAGETMTSPHHGDRDACNRFFNAELPRRLLSLADALEESLCFDGLIVDEAQDHDTVFDPEVGANQDSVGWWEIYRMILREKSAGRVAIFCDINQRHFARSRERFNPEHLTRAFPHLVRVRLRRSVRYTRHLRDFFIKSGLPEATELLADTTDEGLPEGLPPVILQAASQKEEKSAVGRILAEWCKNGPCRPEDVLLLYPTTKARPVWLDNEKVNGVAMARPGTLGVATSSVNKAKGLEAQAVILVGFPPVEQLKDPSAALGSGATWIMGVTRARSLLAVIERTDIEPADLHTF